jgi:hypothetical protein
VDLSPEAEAAEAAAAEESTAVAGEGSVPGPQDLADEAAARSTSPSALAYGEPEIATSPEAMGQHMVKRMNQLNGEQQEDGFGLRGMDTGVHYGHNYEAMCYRWPTSAKWNPAWRMGHNTSGHFTQPHETGQFMTFDLKEGHSASEAVQAWLKGLTIAECYTSVIAIQLDTFRAAIGNDKFDRLFGSTDPGVDKAVTGAHRRLRIGTNDSSADDISTATDVARMAHAGKDITDELFDQHLVPGDWYYFFNYSKYLLKHPGGAWQGENALYMGKNDAGQRLWSGFGASNVTEEHMHDTMVTSYNQERTANDQNAMVEGKVIDQDGKYRDRRYDPQSGEFPERITMADLLADPGYTIDGDRAPRKAGFFPLAGQRLDAKAIQKAAGETGP